MSDTSAAPSDPSASEPSASEPAPTGSAPAEQPPTQVGAVTFPQLPDGMGTPSTFEYENDDVQMVSTAWESAVPEGSTVDGTVTVYSSERFDSPQAFHDWVVPWQERPADEAVYESATVHGQPAWRARDQILWLVRPGLGASVTVDASRIDASSLGSVAEAAHETEPASASDAK